MCLSRTTKCALLLQPHDGIRHRGRLDRFRERGHRGAPAPESVSRSIAVPARGSRGSVMPRGTVRLLRLVAVSGRCSRARAGSDARRRRRLPRPEQRAACTLTVLSAVERRRRKPCGALSLDKPADKPPADTSPHLSHAVVPLGRGTKVAESDPRAHKVRREPLEVALLGALGLVGQALVVVVE